MIERILLRLNLVLSIGFFVSLVTVNGKSDLLRCVSLVMKTAIFNVQEKIVFYDGLLSHPVTSNDDQSDF